MFLPRINRNLQIFQEAYNRAPLTLYLPLVTKTEFSLQYQYNINQRSDENKEKYQFGDN